MPCSPSKAGSPAPPEGPLNEVGGLLKVPEVLPRGLPEVLDKACSKAVVPKRGPACPPEAPDPPPVLANGPATAPAEGLLIPVGEALREEACSAAVVPSFRGSLPAPA